MGLQDIEGHWAEADIRTALQKGYASGFEDHTFRPDTPISRAQYTTMLVKVMKYPLPPTADGQAWDEPYRQTAEDLNLLPPSFSTGLNQPATRLELLYTAYKALWGEEAAPPEERVRQWSLAEGLLRGDESGELQLEKEATRAQTVVFLERLDRIRSGQASTH